MDIGELLDTRVCVEAAGEETVKTVVVAITVLASGGGPKPGGGGAPGGGGGRPPGGGGGGRSPSKSAVNDGGTMPTNEHSPVNQLEVACKSLGVQFALKQGTALTKYPSPGTQIQFH